jgi:hypothetical protein
MFMTLIVLSFSKKMIQSAVKGILEILADLLVRPKAVN